MKIDSRHLWTALALLAASTLAVGCGEAAGDPEAAADTGGEAAAADTDTDAAADTDADTDAETDAASNDDESEAAPAPEGEEVAAAPAPKKTGDSAQPAGEKTGERTITGDWPMWGGDVHRNMVNATTGITVDFEPDGQNQLWKMPAGSQAYANPVVAGGRVFVGANNGSGYRPKYVQDGEPMDLGVVLCFDEKTGKFLWQLSRPKLEAGRVNDWPEQGICSTPLVEGNRLYVLTNRAELMCLDVEGFTDGENDGFQDETDTEEQDADVIWSLDLIEDLGVFPHNLATSSPVVWEDHVYVVTGNGVGEEHLEVIAPRAPSFICVNKNTGELVWEDNSPFDRILHGHWSSPAVGVVNGQAQIYFAGGDGWLYAFEPGADEDGFGKPIWKFDLNPKDSLWLLGGEGTRNAIISTPVFVDNSVVLAVGQDPEHGNGVGHLYRIDATKTGDVSPVLVVDESGEPVEHGTQYDPTKGHQVKPNENSAQMWHLGGIDEDGSVTGRKNNMIFRRTISTAAVQDGLVFVPDLMGYLHCVDFETGERYWEFDTFGEIWGSPMVVDGKVLLGDAEGDLTVFEASKELKELETITFPNSIYCTPTIANGNCYITDRNTLYAFSLEPAEKADAEE